MTYTELTPTPPCSDPDAGFDELDDEPEAEEPEFNFDDEPPPDEDDPSNIPGGTEDPDARRPENVVNFNTEAQGGGASQGGLPERRRKAEQKTTVASLKERKIPDGKRMTTPYMTKYERARVLGTRSLQIR